MQPSTRSFSPGKYAPFAFLWLLSAVICAALLPLPGHTNDIMKYKYWTRQVTLHGIEDAYSGKYPRSYSIYPPVSLYGYKIAGEWYRARVDPAFDFERMEESQTLTGAIKAVPVVYHLALGVVIFWLLLGASGVRWATIASALYLLNPAVIFDLAYWGQPDSPHAFWSVLAFGLGGAGRWVPAWAAIALAAVSKPQAWILGPLFAFRELSAGGPVRVAAGTAIASLTVLAVVLPFLVNDRLSQLLTLPAAMAGHMPIISASAHNLWWLLSGGAQVSHDELLLGPLSYRQVSWSLVGAITVAVLWLARNASLHEVFLLAAYQAFGWFCVMTQVHENHPFFVVPFLALALPAYRWLWPVFIALSLTLLMNMLLHDPILAPRLATLVSADTVWRATLLNAAANLAIFGAWTAWLIRRAYAAKLAVQPA